MHEEPEAEVGIEMSDDREERIEEDVDTRVEESSVRCEVDVNSILFCVCLKVPRKAET